MTCRVTIQIARKTPKLASAKLGKPAILIALAAWRSESSRSKQTHRQDHVGAVEQSHDDQADAVVVQHIRAGDLHRQRDRHDRRTRLSVTR